MPNDEFWDELAAAADAVAEPLDADVFLFNGPLQDKYDDAIAAAAERAVRRSNAFLIVSTNGGSAHCAYRMARLFQRKYKRVTACIAGPCMSAGTLLVIGAHELVMTDSSNLGPLDVQLVVADELFDYASGLTMMQALQSLQSQSFAFFEQTFLEIKRRSENRITLKTAMDVSLRMTTRLFGNIYAQIDPLRLGDDARAIQIAEAYGHRLDQVADNLKPATRTTDYGLSRLVAGYPTHGFVIDRDEATELFNNVRAPSEEELHLLRLLGVVATKPGRDDLKCVFLSTEVGLSDDQNRDTDEHSGQEDEEPNGADSPSSSVPSIRAVQEGGGEQEGDTPDDKGEPDRSPVSSG